MKNQLAILSLAAIMLASCAKKVDAPASDTAVKNQSAAVTAPEYVKYTIPRGDQYCDKSVYAAVKYQQLSFNVKFDSSAIYTTIMPGNQTDINKLFGFSDNNAAHHQYSARFGWRWSNNSLRLFAYVYNNSVVSSKELGTVAIGTENACSIEVKKDTYVFTLNGTQTTMPRESTTTFAEGYKLYPYFGGDEMAPHNISILIKEL